MDTTYGTPDPLKTNILEALHTFIRSRPGLEYCNYGDAASYRAEMRGITRDLHDARTLLHSIERAHGITGRNLVDAARSAFSGRLNIQQVDGEGVRIHYTTGQYYPAEYRRAVAAVAASALWDYVRDYCMPPTAYIVAGKKSYSTIEAATIAAHDYLPNIVAIEQKYNGFSGGDWLRRYFRREFGRGLASRFFN
jgi:uncharacterized protein YutD